MAFFNQGRLMSRWKISDHLYLLWWHGPILEADDGTPPPDAIPPNWCQPNWLGNPRLFITAGTEFDEAGWAWEEYYVPIIPWGGMRRLMRMRAYRRVQRGDNGCKTRWWQP